MGQQGAVTIAVITACRNLVAHPVKIARGYSIASMAVNATASQETRVFRFAESVTLANAPKKGALSGAPFRIAGLPMKTNC
jgi:hypothetical protein